MGFILIVPSARKLYPRPPIFFSGRADNACTNLLGFLVRYVRTRGMAEIAGSAKLPIFILLFVACTYHAWLARLTRARGVSSQREGNALFDDFWYFWSYKSTRKEKVSLNIFLVCQKSINAKRYVDIAARAYERYVNFLDFLH